ncbi:MAG: hypothetical protein MSC45_05850 [Mobiluncus sp.]|uniref:hypothetical protein n=1 Tax=Mobiluncus TaxID=2050 RepID=UPI0012B1F015|nr:MULTISPECIES: hypothetical protein [Mobiluncus]MCI6584575.1 hypothetical protein [Mobiluncus sp.]MDD7541587.1 hypothetical protein [Mobiluncus porci]
MTCAEFTQGQLYLLGGAVVALTLWAVSTVISVFYLHTSRRLQLATAASCLMVLLVGLTAADLAEALVFGKPVALSPVVATLPAAAAWIGLAVIGAGELLLTLIIAREKHRVLSVNVIKNAVDELPDGLGFATPQGELLLGNYEMAEMQCAVTGKSWGNFNEFLAALDTGDLAAGQVIFRNPLVVRSESGKVWSLSTRELAGDLEGIRETRAEDLTAASQIGRKLDLHRERFSQLQDKQLQLQAASREIEVSIAALRRALAPPAKEDTAQVATAAFLRGEGGGSVSELVELWRQAVGSAELRGENNS